jgi:hypothetical protein
MAAMATGRGRSFRITAIFVALVAVAFLESAVMPSRIRRPATRSTVTAGTDSGVSGTVSNLRAGMSSGPVLTAASPGQAAIQDGVFRPGGQGTAPATGHSRALATVIVVSARRHRSLFGRPVRVTATVTARLRRTGARPVSPLHGAVTFYLCVRPSRLPPGSAMSACQTLVPLNLALPINRQGRSHLAVPGLPGGPHPVFASFRPADPAAYAASVSPSVTRVVTFSRPCLTTTLSGRYRVARGQSLCVGRPARITGTVTVDPGGALSVTGAVIRGAVIATRAKGVRICQTAVTGGVSVRSARGFVEIGAGGALPCGGNTIGSRLSLRRDHRGFAVVGNRIGQALALSRNSGDGPFWLHAAGRISGNRIGVARSCGRKHPAPAGRRTRHRPARRTGPCAPLAS